MSNSNKPRWLPIDNPKESDSFQHALICLDGENNAQALTQAILRLGYTLGLPLSPSSTDDRAWKKLSTKLEEY